MCKEQDCYFMTLALKEAQKAYQEREVPVGALVVYNEEVVARGYNRVQQDSQGVAHADLLVLQEACKKRMVKYLPECTLYVTLEPCAMCAGACYWTQIGRVVFGASDEKRGYQQWSPSLLHPKTVVVQGVGAEESRELLQAFFRELRGIRELPNSNFQLPCLL